MTRLIAREAQSVTRCDTEIIAVNPPNGPAAIQGPEDGEAALPHLFALFDDRMKRDHFDAVIIACFDDTGLWILKDKSPVPVIGIGEAGYHAAMLLARKFSVVTTLPASLPVLKENIDAYGMGSRCAHIRASNVPVLALEAHPQAAKAAIDAQIHQVLQQDDASAIVLGCAGMADIAAEFEHKYQVPVIDGVKAAIGLCETLVKIRPA